MKKLSIPHTRFIVTMMCLFFSPTVLLAAGPPEKSVLENPMVLVLVAVIIILLVVIIALAYVLSGAAQFYLKRLKETTTAKSFTVKTIAIILCCFPGISSFAQQVNESAETSGSSITGLSSTTLFALLSVIIVELIVILSLAYFIKRFLAKEEETNVFTESTTKEKKESLLKKLWDRANNFRSLKEETDMDLGHDYDNIRELDNRLPPWWLYGFYCTIIFAAIYLWRSEVSHAAPSSLEEYTASVQKAEEEKEAYLANAANKVDENTIQMLDAAGIESGKVIFTSTCAPCHGADGGGVVGPNLTDDYWLHGGSLKDIFKTIKYGVQEKGMKSWKDDLSPVQIAQLASYIRSIHGAKVANPKEPQGELFKDINATDSVKSTAVISQ